MDQVRTTNVIICKHTYPVRNTFNGRWFNGHTDRTT